MKSSEVDQSCGLRSIDVLINANCVGFRLDQFVVHVLPHLSRSSITSSVKKGSIRVDGKIQKSSYRLKLNEQVSGVVEQKDLPDLAPQKIDLTIIYEDEFVIVLSKPPGLVVHPGSGNTSNTLVNGLLYHCHALDKIGEPARPGIVHRLDKDTSGIMVVAKTESTHRGLVEAFKNHQVAKQYLALVHGILKDKTGRIVGSIGRHSVNRQKMEVKQIGGKHAASNYKVLEELDNRYSLVQVEIETGRTHQIRVHMAHLGHPVVGDTKYGSNRANKIFPRQLLHAYKLVFPHPLLGNVTKCAPLWPDFSHILHELGSTFTEIKDFG